MALFPRLIIAIRISWIVTGLVATLASLFMISGCAESAGSGASVTIPIVQINCVTSRCRAATSARAFIVYTTSSCANPQFGETVAGSNTALLCNGTSCSGSITSFTNQSGLSTTTIREGYYSVCAIIDFNTNYGGSAVAGEDSTGALADTLVTSGSSTKIVTAFSDI